MTWWIDLCLLMSYYFVLKSNPSLLITMIGKPCPVDALGHPPLQLPNITRFSGDGGLAVVAGKCFHWMICYIPCIYHVLKIPSLVRTHEHFLSQPLLSQRMCNDTELHRPTSMALSSSGDLYFTDSKNFRIRRVSTDGVIESVAGKLIF